MSTTSFKYSEAERMLARLVGMPRQQRTTFRARITQLKKLGIPFGVSPGRGAKFQYEKEHIYQWAIAFELMQCGRMPSEVVGALKEFWPQLFKWMVRAERKRAVRGDDTFLYFVPRFIRNDEGVRKVDHLQEVDRAQLANLLQSAKFQRAVIVNLSEIVRRFEARLTLPPEAA